MNLRPRVIRLLAITAAAVIHSTMAAQSGAIRAAAVKVDVTSSGSKWLAGYPARQSNGVHDHIFHRVAVAAKLKSETGIDPLPVWWTVTHTHSAPEVGPHAPIKVLMPERYNHPPETRRNGHAEPTTDHLSDAGFGGRCAQSTSPPLSLPLERTRG